LSDSNSESIYLRSIWLSKGTIVKLRTKEPNTISAPELTNYQKEGGELSAERTLLKGNTRLRPCL